MQDRTQVFVRRQRKPTVTHVEVEKTRVAARRVVGDVSGVTCPLRLGVPSLTEAASADVETHVVKAVAPLPPPPLRMTARELGIGATIKERFELVDLLGVGGMGVVYKARDLRQQEAGEAEPWVAVKVLNAQLLAEDFAVAALQQECRRSQQLAHPNIVNVHDFDRDGDIVFMTMECLRGTSLDEVVHAFGFSGLPLDQVKGILRNVGEALLYAHGQGVIHSDLKPSNIFITETGRAKIFDFGIARAMQTVAGTDQDMIAYTPSYASLGMLQGDAPDPADDAYALACVLYLLLTGRHPFQRRPADQALRQQMKPEPVARISRRQWHVLRRVIQPGTPRTDGVQDLVAAFCQPQPLNTRWLKYGLASMLALILLFVSVTHIHNQALFSMVSELISDDSAQVLAATEGIKALSPEQKVWVLEESREPLLRFLRNEVKQAIAVDEFMAVEPLLDRLHRLYSDSMQMLQVVRDFEHQRQRRVDTVLAAIQSVLAQTEPMSAATIEGLQQHLTLLSQINPRRFDALSAGIAEKIAFHANRHLYQGQMSAAQSLIAVALATWPDDVRLSQLKYRAARLRSGSDSVSGRSVQLGLDQDSANAIHEYSAAEVAAFSLQTGWQAFVGGLTRLDSNYADLVQLAISQFIKARLEQGNAAQAADYRQLGRALMPQDPLFKVAPQPRRDPCGNSLAGQGGLSRYHCRDRITAADYGPDLVVIPGKTRLPPFAMTAAEITVGQYNLYCRLYRRCQQRNEAPDLPLRNISLQQAQAYASWLSQLSGRVYRLPTWQQWQHAVVATDEAVLPDHNCLVEQNGRLVRGGEVRATGSGHVNPWGLRDALGNVAEWVRDGSRWLLAGGDHTTPMRACVAHRAVEDDGRPGPTKGIRLIRVLGG